jgi:two-component system chemotaxis response regulator CheY
MSIESSRRKQQTLLVNTLNRKPQAGDTALDIRGVSMEMVAKALVLDDSRAMRGVLSKILNALGFSTLQASNGIEALAVMDIESHGADGKEIVLILADWNMPEMNGLEFVKALRAQPRYSAVRVIMVTSETNVDQMLEALAAGADEYIMKPFTAQMVEEKLRILEICSH